MRLAKVIVLSDSVEVVVTKTIQNGKHTLDVKFIAEIEDELFTTTKSGEYSTKKLRDTDYEAMNEEVVRNLASTMSPFKDEI